MATIVGTVEQVIGVVHAVDSTGAMRVLVVGDAVYANETILTGEEGYVAINLVDGHLFDLGRNGEAVLDSDLIAVEAAPAAADQVALSVEAIQEAIAAGIDPTTLVPATAAGPAAGAEDYGPQGSGHTFVMLDPLLTEAVVGVPELDTEAFGLAFPDVDYGVGAETELIVVPGDELLVVDETDLGVDATKNFSGWFSVDGPGSVGGYALGIADAGVDSGLVDTASDEGIYLFLENGEVVGRVGLEGAADTDGAVAFTLKVGSGGNVTLDQVSAVVHPTGGESEAAHDEGTFLSAANLITLSATVSGGDGLPEVSTVNIGDRLVFEDDGPAASAKAEVTASTTLDETGGLDSVTIQVADIAGLFNAPVYGEDGAGSVSYALSATDGIATGLWLTGQTGDGNEIVLVKVSDTQYEGREGDAYGTLAFTISINASSGEVTVTQNATLEHTYDGATPAHHDDPLSLSGVAAVSVVQTVTDGDGDYDTATSGNALSITFHDDGPALFVPEHADLVNIAGNSVTEDLSSSNTDFANMLGADGFGSVAFVPPSSGTWWLMSGTENVTVTNAIGEDGKVYNIELSVSSDPYVLVGNLVHVDGSEGQWEGHTAITITLNPDSNEYTVSLGEHALDDGSWSAYGDFLGLHGGSLEWYGQDSDHNDIDDDHDGSYDLLIRPDGDYTLNTTSNDIGTGNQHVMPDQGLRVDMVQNLYRDTGNEKVADGFAYDNHYQVSGFGFTLAQVQKDQPTTVDIEISAFNDGNVVALDVGSIVVIGNTDFDTNVDAYGVITITGLNEGDVVSFAAVSGSQFDAVTIYNVTGDDVGFGMSNFVYAASTPGNDFDISVDVVAADGDGDYVFGDLDISVLVDGS